MRVAQMEDTEGYLTFADIERPSPDTNEVLVKMRAASICGSDIHHVTGEIPIENKHLPLVLGHEGAGRIVETGDEVDHLNVGDRVAIHYVVSCGHCRNCMRGNDNRCRNRASVGYTASGVFSEYVCIDARSAIPLPEAVPFETASIAGCAVVTGFHAIKTSDLSVGDTAVVFGAGGVGVHAVLFADFVGAKRIFVIEPIEGQHKLARAYGADEILNPKTDDIVDQVMAMTDGWGADVSLECSGETKAMEQSLKVVDSTNKFESGTAVSVGFQSEPFTAEYWGLREGALKVSGDHTRDELVRLLDLLANDKIDISKSITHRLPFEDINDGIDLVMDRDESVCRVVLKFD